MIRQHLMGSVAASVLITGSAPPPTVFPSFTTISPAAGWGVVRRNAAYTGPAVRVRNDSSGDETDVAFDANGFVNTTPYGSDTRVITIYDQWGSEDFEHTDPTNSDTLLEIDAGDEGYHISPGAAYSRFITPSTVADAPSWKLDDPVWLIAVERTSATTLRTVAKVEALGAGYMTCGLWQDAQDWHWRVNGGGAADWSGTNWNAQANAVQGEWDVVFLDYSQQSGDALGYSNNTLSSTYAYTDPLDYSATASPLYLFDGSTGSEFSGKFSELHIFDRVANLSISDRALLFNAARQIVTPNTDTGWDANFFLASWDGVGGAQPTPEESPIGAALTYTGAGAVVATSPVKIGTASLRVSSGNYVAFPAPSSPIYGDFTLETWAQFNSVNTFDTLFGDFDNSFGSWALWLNGSTKPEFLIKNVIDGALVGTTTPSTATFYHIAVCRDGDTLYLYFDGTAEDSLPGVTGIPLSSRALQPYLGRDVVGNPMDGWLDETRFTREAIYPGGATFTPPTVAFDRS